MATLTVLRGLPASGKSTYAKAWINQDPRKRLISSRDDLRRVLFNLTRKTKLTHEQEKLVTRVQRDQ